MRKPREPKYPPWGVREAAKRLFENPDVEDHAISFARAVFAHYNGTWADNCAEIVMGAHNELARIVQEKEAEIRSLKERIADILQRTERAARPTPNLRLALDVIKAAKAFLAAYATVEGAIDSAFMFQHIHGQPYEGPTIGEELGRLHVALDAFEAGGDA